MRSSLHEFLGISMVGAVGVGAFPLPSRRLAYSEAIPSLRDTDCL